MRGVLMLFGVAFALITGGLTPADDTAKTASTKPLTSKDLAGTYRGERDGAKVVFRADKQPMWEVDTKDAGGNASAHVEAALRLVDDKASGSVELHFDPTRGPPSVLMGRLTRGEGGSLKLTILPTARKQSEYYYQLLKDFPLDPDRGGK